MLFHPEWDRACTDCRKYLYDEDGTVTRRVGLPVLRPAGVKTPCWKCPKIPAGEDTVWTNAIELTPENYQAYLHYRECRAVGQFPDDAIVRRNAAIIREIEDYAEQRPLLQLLQRMSVKA